MCIKITHSNTCDNDDNTSENYSNTRGKSYELKLNDMDYHINYHVKFDAQLGTQISVPSIIDSLMFKYLLSESKE